MVVDRRADCALNVRLKEGGARMFGSDERLRAAVEEQKAQEAEARRQREAAFPGFRPSATEPAFRYLCFVNGRAREIRLFEKHLTFHEQAGRGTGDSELYENLYVIPYRSINYVNYTDVLDEPTVFIYAADLSPSLSGSEAEVREMTQRLATLIG